MPAEKREAVGYFINEQQFSFSKACKMVRLPRISYWYQRIHKDDSTIQGSLTALISKHPTIGFWQCYYRFRNRGEKWSHKRVPRIYIIMKLNISRRAKKRLPERVKQPLVIPTEPNQM